MSLKLTAVLKNVKKIDLVTLKNHISAVIYSSI